jgi:predicted O-methyltransferase YrrM
MIEPKLTSHALVAVDNVLMSGEVALGEDADTFWSKENLQSARELNQSLMSSGNWLTSVLPVGDGVALATRAP